MYSEKNTKLIQQFEQYITSIPAKSNKRTIKMLNGVLEELKIRECTLVTEGTVFKYRYGAYIARKEAWGVYYLCPRCGACIEREYMLYCHNCGQAFKWGSLKKINFI